MGEVPSYEEARGQGGGCPTPTPFLCQVQCQGFQISVEEAQLLQGKLAVIGSARMRWNMAPHQ